MKNSLNVKKTNEKFRHFSSPDVMKLLLLTHHISTVTGNYTLLEIGRTSFIFTTAFILHGFVKWCVILLEATISRYVHCGHKGMDMSSNNMKVVCGVQMMV